MWLYESRTLPEVTEHRTDRATVSKFLEKKYRQKRDSLITFHRHCAGKMSGRIPIFEPRVAKSWLEHGKKYATDPRPASNQREEKSQKTLTQKSLM